MVGYSARLAVCTTLTSLIFSGLARIPAWELSVFVALPFLACVDRSHRLRPQRLAGPDHPGADRLGRRRVDPPTGRAIQSLVRRWFGYQVRVSPPGRGNAFTEGVVTDESGAIVATATSTLLVFDLPT